MSGLIIRYAVGGQFQNHMECDDHFKKVIRGFAVPQKTDVSIILLTFKKLAMKKLNRFSQWIKFVSVISTLLNSIRKLIEII